MFAEWDFLFIAHTPSFTFFGRRNDVGFVVVKVVGILTTTDNVFRSCVERERRTKSRTKKGSSSSSSSSSASASLSQCFPSFYCYKRRASSSSKRVTKKPLPLMPHRYIRAHTTHLLLLREGVLLFRNAFFRSVVIKEEPPPPRKE